MLYTRASRFCSELLVARTGDGGFTRRHIAQPARLDLLLIDGFALAPIAAHERSDLLELLDDRVGSRSTIITSQLPLVAWHEWLGEPTLADAILDRTVHGAHKIGKRSSHGEEFALGFTPTSNRDNEHGKQNYPKNSASA